MFIISLEYKVDLDKVDIYLDEHVEYLKRMYKEGNFILSGRKVPRTGGVILSNISSKEELMNLLREDPFHRECLADYTLTEIVPSMSSNDLEFLI